MLNTEAISDRIQIHPTPPLQRVEKVLLKIMKIIQHFKRLAQLNYQ